MSAASTRQLIVVDVETTSLERDADILEVAAVNVQTGEEFAFVPHFSMDRLQYAQPQALQVNRYFERGAFERMQRSPEESYDSYRLLANLLRDNTFGGSNPRFDSDLIACKFSAMTGGSLANGKWHHRLADIANYAAGPLGLDPTDLPGLDRVCELLGVTNEEPHSALGDARATAECFRRVVAMRRGRQVTLLLDHAFTAPYQHKGETLCGYLYPVRELRGALVDPERCGYGPERHPKAGAR